MLDQRRHQRIRFGILPTVRIGYGGAIGEGVIENLSLAGHGRGIRLSDIGCGVERGSIRVSVYVQAQVIRPP